MLYLLGALQKTNELLTGDAGTLRPILIFMF